MGHSFGGHIFEFYAATFRKEVVSNTSEGYPRHRRVPFFQVEKLILLEAWSPTPVARELYIVAQYNQMYEISKARHRAPRYHTYEEALSIMMKERWTKLNSKAAVALLNRCLTRTENGYVFNSDPRTRWEIKPALDEDTLLFVYSRIGCPVLVVLGTESEFRCIHGSSGFCKNVLEQLKKTHPQSRIVHVDGNHCLHNNNPEAVAPIISQFLFDAKSNL